MSGLIIVRVMAITSETGCAAPNSSVRADNTRCSRPGDPHGAERGRWLPYRNWHKWLCTSDALPGLGTHRAGFLFVRMTIPPPVCERPGTPDNGSEYWLIPG